MGTEATQWHGNRPADYSTDVLTSLAVDFVGTTPSDRPLLLYYSVYGAHAPFKPAPRHVGLWHKEMLSPAATQLTRNRPKFLPDSLLPYRKQQRHLRRQHEALMAVDEGVAAIYRALGSRASNTLFVYLSDNGLQFGEHALSGKYVPYSGATDVPMFARWDGVLPAGTTHSALTTNADLAATIADAAGVSLDSPDGRSLFAERESGGQILEAIKFGGHPAYCGYRTRRYAFVHYSDGMGEELYDYRKDPDELRNVVKIPPYRNITRDLRERTRSACIPTPPGFTWG